ncbi:MAG: flagellar biosynthesis protein FlhA [Thermodesulfobacteriota bacterium]
MALSMENLARFRKGTEYLLPLGVLGILAMMILPMPPLLLDILLSFNITAAIVILLVGIYVRRPLDFSTFPVILLMTTLSRLSMNIASTRLILLEGSNGPGAAGNVIRSFGQFVVGGNYAVGFIVFIILVIINFVVITKGAGRIAEVSARFTLDAMPGKQMAIDADLNAGLIDNDEARRRRTDIALEADFYGSMDGASKFVRGDAVAGILITVINIFGGLFIGVFQHGMEAGEAARTYTILTVGDGLVAQIPALIISTAAGVIVSHVSSSHDLGKTIGRQFTSDARPAMVASAILFLFALVPGLPHLAFFILSLLAGGLAFIIHRFGGLVEAEEDDLVEAEEVEEASSSEPLEFVPRLDTLSLEVGYRLIPLVDSSGGGDLLERIRAIRSHIAEDLGLIVPPVHIKDNLDVRPSEYVFLIKGIEVARAELMPGNSLAIDPGNARPGLEGAPAKDPTFGLPAVWVPDESTEKAQVMGYTVVPHAAIIATHLTELIKEHTGEILGRQDVQVLLDRFAETSPKVVEELVPGLLTLGGVHKVLQNLLGEQVSIRDLQTILETLADYAAAIKDTDLLTEYVRMRLARQISRTFQDDDGTLRAVVLGHEVEDVMEKSLRETPQGLYLTIEPGVARSIMEKIEEGVREVTAMGYRPVILTSKDIRRFLRRLTERSLASIPVLSHNELARDSRVQTLKVVRL